MTPSADAPAADSSFVAATDEDRVLVLDFGSQTAQLIARRVREQNVFCQIVRHDLSADRIRELAPKGLILSGGPASVYAPGAPQPDPRIFELGIPILGICYGMQVAARAHGGDVRAGNSREFGRTTLSIAADDPLLAGLPPESTVWMSHGDQVEATGNLFTPPGNHRNLPSCRRPPQLVAAVWLAISSRSHAHGPRWPTACQLRPRHLRLPRNLENQQLNRP